jgi:hypothetical protein
MDYDALAAEKRRFLSLLETLSIAIQSPQAIERLIGSQFFDGLVHLLQRLIDSPQADSANQPLLLNLLKTLVSIADFECGQGWLCASGAGSRVWHSLIEALCKAEPNLTKASHTEEIGTLVVKLVKRMLFCNASNQAKFADFLNELIARIVPLDSLTAVSANSPPLSGFLNQLILQV